MKPSSKNSSRTFFITVSGIAAWGVLALLGTAEGAPTEHQSAIVPEVTQIRVSPQKELNFDQDIEKLAEMEKRYKERLPYVRDRSRLLSPMARIQAERYQYKANPKK